jgi:predicted DNA-binding transcriptional regulator YafY
MPKGTRAIPARQKQIAQLVKERQEAVKRNSSLKLHTRASLAEAIEWSESTVRDDIRDMQADGQPIKFDTSRKGYVYTEKYAGVPTAFITESDLAQLCLGIRSLEALKGTPLYKPIHRALDKMTRGLIDEFGINFEELKSTVTFRNTGVDALTDPAVIETLMHAVQGREELEIIYSKLNQSDAWCSASVPTRQESDDNSASDIAPQLPTSPHPAATIPSPNAPWLQLPIETRKVHPLHLLCHDNAWYLWLWDPMRKDKIRSFALSRIRSIARTGETYRPRKFDVNEQVHDSFGVTSGKPVVVKIQFRRKASYLVAERPWHHSMKLTPGPGDEWNLELTMKVAITPELIKWIMGYDEDAKVIEPAPLRDLIAAKGAGIAANYGNVK